METGPRLSYRLDLTLWGEAWCSDCEAYVPPVYWADGRWPSCPIAGCELGRWDPGSS